MTNALCFQSSSHKFLISATLAPISSISLKSDPFPRIRCRVDVESITLQAFRLIAPSRHGPSSRRVTLRHVASRGGKSRNDDVSRRRRAPLLTR